MPRPLSRERRDEVDAIVFAIVDDMASGRWVTGRSHKEYAAKNGVAVSRVQDWACEAGRVLRVLAMVDRESLRERNQARLDAIAADAYQAGEFGDAVRAIGEQNKLLGLHAPSKMEVNVQAYGHLSPDEKLVKVEEQIEALERIRAHLLQQRSVPALQEGEPK